MSEVEPVVKGRACAVEVGFPLAPEPPEPTQAQGRASLHSEVGCTGVTSSLLQPGVGDSSLESFPLEGHCPAYAKTCVPHTASPYLLPSALMAPSWNLGHGPWLLPWSPLVPRSKSSNLHLHQQALHPISPSLSPSRCAPASCACLLIQTPQSDLVNVQL